METKETVKINEDISNRIVDFLNEQTGFDFSDYASPSLCRRFQRYVSLHNVTDLESFFQDLKENSLLLNQFIEEITVNVTEMFRDPLFYLSLRNEVLPELKKLEHIKIWHAGCSTGEEVYSMAIMLNEEGILNKTLIYATDINQTVLARAKSGEYDAESIKLYAQNYKESEAKNDFYSNFQMKEGIAFINPELKKNIIFSSHNLVSEGVFNQFDLIVCRNVLIYFNKTLQNQVLETFYKSLASNAFLALGSKETLLFSPIETRMRTLNPKWKTWRKVE